MIGAEYRAFVRKMSTKPDGSTMPLYVAALGLAGEAAEWAAAVDDEEDALEAGDVVFYVTAICNTLDISDVALQCTGIIYEDVEDAPRNYMSVLAGRVCDRIKKMEWHDAQRRGTVALVFELAEIMACLDNYSKHTIEELQAANVAKLTARHPNGFGR